jgi:GT2 family glycosyltransferase
MLAEPLPDLDGRILAVVLNWCAGDDTARCLASLITEQARIPALDIPLADSASPDGCLDRLASRFPGVAYLPIGANLGDAGGNQRAIEWALARAYEFVLLINDDASLTPGCLIALMHAMRSDPSVGACAPTVTYGPPHDDRVWWGGGSFVWWKGMGVHHHVGYSEARLREQYPHPRAVTFLSGCVLLLPAEAIRRSGGLPAEFFAHVEEVELCYRSERQGWRLLWVPAATARHHVPVEAGEPSPFAITLRDRNQRLEVRHFGGFRLAVFRAVFFGARQRALWAGMKPIGRGAGGQSGDARIAAPIDVQIDERMQEPGHARVHKQRG